MLSVSVSVSVAILFCILGMISAYFILLLELP